MSSSSFTNIKWSFKILSQICPSDGDVFCADHGGLSTLIVYYLSSIIDSMYSEHPTKAELHARGFSFKEFLKIQTEIDTFIIIINNLFSIIMHNTISITIYIIYHILYEAGHPIYYASILHPLHLISCSCSQIVTLHPPLRSPPHMKKNLGSNLSSIQSMWLTFLLYYIIL